MDQNKLKVLIEKYLAGQCSPDEIKAIDQWYDSFEADESFVNQLSQADKATLEKKLLKGVNAKIAASRFYETKKIISSVVHKHWYKAAAATAFMITSFLAYFFIFNATTDYATAYAEIRRIILPDSSSVILNANSTLSYKSNWNYESPREVWLEGEAFFEVQKLLQNSQPTLKDGLQGMPEKVKFIVHTRNLDVEVTGTTFNVNHRREQTQVVLNTGKVTIARRTVKTHEQPTGNIRMNPGDLVELSTTTNVISRMVVDPDDYSAWRYKKLVFKRTPLARLAEKFQDYYGIEMLFEDTEIGERQLTGSIPTDSMELFLKILSESMQLDIKRTGGRVHVKNKITADKE